MDLWSTWSVSCGHRATPLQKTFQLDYLQPKGLKGSVMHVAHMHISKADYFARVVRGGMLFI